MSENQEPDNQPKPEAPRDPIAELAALAGEAGKSGVLSIGEGLELDVGRIREMFFKNLYCQGAIAQFAQARKLLSREYRPDNPNPTPGRFCCFAHAIGAQFAGMIEGFALAAAIIATEGMLPNSDRKTLMHGFSKLFDEACVVAAQIKSDGGPQSHMPTPKA